MTWIKKLGMEYPMIQAPMAGVTTPEFVAASAEVGLLGSIGAGYLSAEETRDFIRKVRGLTDKPFAVNLFVPENSELNQEQLREAYEGLQLIGEKFGMPFWKVDLSKSEFDEQIQVVIEEGVKVCSFTFGLPDDKAVRLLKDNGVFLIGTATTVEEAVLVEQAGMDAIVVQGSEAGGHRGSFLGELKFIPLNELLVDVGATVRLPIIAAGGIANKAHMDGALKAGAEAVQIGTVLLATDESGAHSLYKKAVLNAEEGSTVFTTAFSGKTARGIRNRFMDEMKTAPMAPYPYQNDLTKKLRAEAAKQGKPEYMSLWAGESVHLTEAGTVREIMGWFI
ncbi:NAD(P)H-dependent flavin oxidoreductase [Sporosarcina limicola]|uniref:Probable nitronate monooxygenase n=1 Tax=Sporosarcina limicola TaxID=34101 RepID=A0A927R2V7_9BACL|nr:nitronate monooxygenase [Sporosarcina limicola]MBE1553068.1 nitronate monooxygenase [Sporosarcina limicola]